VQKYIYLLATLHHILGEGILGKTPFRFLRCSTFLFHFNTLHS